MPTTRPPKKPTDDLPVPADALLDESALAARSRLTSPLSEEDENEVDVDLAPSDAPAPAADDELEDDEAVVADDAADADQALDPAAVADVKAALIPGVLDESAAVPKAKTQQVPSHWIQKPLEPDDLFDKGSI